MAYNLPPPPLLKTTIIQLNKELDNESSNYEILTSYDNYNNNNGNSNSSSGDQAGSTPSTPPVVEQQKRKRRRSTANIDEEELAKRKSETKQLHSIIEKRRRIKINREFEALKYLIPACRSTGSSNSNNATTPGGKQQPTKLASNNSNNNKIDGMYKLTILKSSVEYILYLHHILQQQNAIISQLDPNHNFDVLWAQIPLDVNQYRNIDKEFNFNELAENFEQQLLQTNHAALLLLQMQMQMQAHAPQPLGQSSMPQFNPQQPKYRPLPLNQIQEEDVIEEQEEQVLDSTGNPNASIRNSHSVSISIELEHKSSDSSESTAVPSHSRMPDVTPTNTAASSSASTAGAGTIATATATATATSESSDQQLPSPQITPDMGPVFTLLSNFEHSKVSAYDSSVSPVFQFSPKCQLLKSNLASKFLLPDPALTSYPTNNHNNNNSLVRSTSSSSMSSATPITQSGSFSLPSSTSSTPYLFPKRKYFKSKNPNGETLNFILKNSFSIVDDEGECLPDMGTDSKEHDASQTLLTLRKSSIDNLLN
ncbi:uncharacterized protein KQ657_001265 [Scheffersomyces spartinae]|uniref:BHLH domain-containing protein n=1 Tax=Scheffersomyces spartinae TaxID=45513 RepID=A0A9P7V7T2_9ASCO|nr:uncharacterized protein KQ657_001265 [Scheffersomyces spartinae]KAG7192810.1 hypothetical protein KQ657_001265 [Scheffersomyces spartinae]